MFSYDLMIDIRTLEAFLYEGPEMVEQIYERNDHFHSTRMRRRSKLLDPNVSNDDIIKSKDILYSYYINPETNDIVYV